MAFPGVPRDVIAIIEANQQTAPVKVIKIAHQFGLRVFVENLRPAISGKLYQDTESQAGWSISVNKTHVKTRRRFTIAHEIGHYVLHRDLARGMIEDDTFYRSSLSNKEETEANKFAADVLMPYALIDSLTAQGVDTPERLAEALHVSCVAMNIRLGLPT